MRLHQTISLLICLCRQGIGIGGERYLAIYHHAPAFREADDNIGTEVLAVLILGIFLDKELLVLSQTTVFQDGFQYHLAPVALHLAVALQSLGKIGGIGTNLRCLLFQTRYGLLLLLLEEFHRSLKGILQLLFVHFVLGLAFFYRFLEIGELLLNWFQEFIHLKSVVFLQGRLLGCELFCRHTLLLDGHSLHLLLQVFEFLHPLLVAFCPEFGGILPFVLHLNFQGLNLRSMRLLQGLNLRSMMQIALFNVSLQHLRLRYKLRFLLSRLLGFHQFAHEEADGKTNDYSYYYFHYLCFK